MLATGVALSAPRGEAVRLGSNAFAPSGEVRPSRPCSPLVAPRPDLGIGVGRSDDWASGFAVVMKRRSRRALGRSAGTSQKCEATGRRCEPWVACGACLSGNCEGLGRWVTPPVSLLTPSLYPWILPERNRYIIPAQRPFIGGIYSRHPETPSHHGTGREGGRKRG